jgi:chaperonin GroES
VRSSRVGHRRIAQAALRSHVYCLTRPSPIHAVTLVHLESKSMNVRPLHDRIIIQRLEEGEQKVGGIIIPDTAKEKPQQGKVIAAGTGKVKDDGTRQRPDVKAGDLILFGKYSGQEIKLDGEDYIIMREDEILGVIEGADAKKKK